jgi:hypothetical protein
MLASLRHPCVVAFYGVVSAHVPLTVTEFMCDGSLRGALLRLQQEEQFVVRVRHPSTVYCEREREREREWPWWAHTGGGNALAFKPPPMRPGDATPVVFHPEPRLG